MAENKEVTSSLHVVVFPWLAVGHMLPFLELSKRLARRGHAVTFVSTPRNATRLCAIPPELSANVRIVSLDLPEVDGLPVGAESTADVPPEKVELLKKAFDGLAAPFAGLVAETCAAAAAGEAAGRFLRKPDWIVLDFAQNWIWPIAEEHEVSRSYHHEKELTEQRPAIFFITSYAFMYANGMLNNNTVSTA